VDLLTYYEATLTEDNEQIDILGVWHVELRKVINIDIFCHQSVVLATDVFGEPHIMSTSTGYAFDVGHRTL